MKVVADSMIYTGKRGKAREVDDGRSERGGEVETDSRRTVGLVTSFVVKDHFLHVGTCERRYARALLARLRALRYA